MVMDNKTTKKTNSAWTGIKRLANQDRKMSGKP